MVQRLGSLTFFPRSQVRYLRFFLGKKSTTCNEIFKIASTKERGGMDISLGYCLRNVTRILSVVLVATTWTSCAGFSFSRRCINAMARRCTIERVKEHGTFALSMVHMRALAFMH